MMTASHQDRELTVGELFGSDAPESARSMRLADITMDSRRVTPGALFIAVAGDRYHGLDFLRQAVTQGAVVVAWEPTPGRTGPVIAPPAACFPVPNLRARLGGIADRFFGAPSKAAQVVGVTGTNGKTTCAHLVASALEDSGCPAGYLGTLGAGMPGRLQASDLTTADVIETHRRLADLVRQGARAAAVEVSSHALDQGRVQGVRFKVAAFTNLSRDHLDYHGDMNSYAAAKRRLFVAPGLQWAIANVDDAAGPRMLETARSTAKTVSVGKGVCAVADRSLVIQDCRPEPAGMVVRFSGDWGEIDIASRMLGRFNVDNLGLALAILLVMDVPAERAANALARVPAPPGRMEMFVDRHQAGPGIVVDYAHSPDALDKAIAAVRLHCGGRLTVVFGCGGDRDRGKRAQMGRIAEAAADTVIVTDDNPRSENGDLIVADILSGMTCRPRVVRDREAAIRGAFRDALAGDVVLVAGKGHEDYQVTGETRRHFSDRELAARLTGGAY